MKYVEEIRRAAQHAAELIQQLLTRAGQTRSPPPAGKASASRPLRDLAHDHSSQETILLVEDDEAVRNAVMDESTKRHIRRGFRLDAQGSVRTSLPSSPMRNTFRSDAMK